MLRHLWKKLQRLEVGESASTLMCFYDDFFRVEFFHHHLFRKYILIFSNLHRKVTRYCDGPGNDVDDFYKTGPDSPLLDDVFSGLGRRIYVKYVSIDTGTNPNSFVVSGIPTNYKQITVKVGIPGTTDSTQLDAIKAAKVNQGYSLTFSPYGI